MAKADNTSWDKIFHDYKILEHDFSKSPFALSAKDIKTSCQEFTETSQKEVRILCKQDTRESRPDIFIKNNIFLLPVRNGKYVLIQGEGYVDIPNIESEPNIYISKLEFQLESSEIGDSEMQHLDFAYAASLVRTFTEDPSLVLTIRGRKYTPPFKFKAAGHIIDQEKVQTEVDAGYEGREQIVLMEAKNFSAKNTIIRQLYYPFRQWQERTHKKVVTLFFDKDRGGDVYSIWKFEFEDPMNYNSIHLIKSGKFRIQQRPGD